MGTKSLSQLKLIRSELYNLKSKLEEEALVKEYIDTLKSLDGVNSEITNKEYDAKIRKQNKCSHDAWYLIDTDQDYHSLNVDYKCSCLQCGLIKTDRYRRFSYIFDEKGYSYFEAQELYRKYMRKLKSAGIDFDKEVFLKTLTKKKK